MCLNKTDTLVIHCSDFNTYTHIVNRERQSIVYITQIHMTVRTMLTFKPNDVCSNPAELNMNYGALVKRTL